LSNNNVFITCHYTVTSQHETTLFPTDDKKTRCKQQEQQPEEPEEQQPEELEQPEEPGVEQEQQEQPV